MEKAFDLELKRCIENIVFDAGFESASGEIPTVLAKVAEAFLNGFGRSITVLMQHGGRTQPTIEDTAIVLKRLQIAAWDLYCYVNYKTASKSLVPQTLKIGEFCSTTNTSEQELQSSLIVNHNQKKSSRPQVQERINVCNNPLKTQMNSDFSYFEHYDIEGLGMFEDYRPSRFDSITRTRQQRLHYKGKGHGRITKNDHTISRSATDFGQLQQYITKEPKKAGCFVQSADTFSKDYGTKIVQDNSKIHASSESFQTHCLDDMPLLQQEELPNDQTEVSEGSKKRNDEDANVKDTLLDINNASLRALFIKLNINSTQDHDSIIPLEFDRFEWPDFLKKETLKYEEIDSDFLTYSKDEYGDSDRTESTNESSSIKTPSSDSDDFALPIKKNAEKTLKMTRKKISPNESKVKARKPPIRLTLNLRELRMQKGQTDEIESTLLQSAESGCVETINNKDHEDVKVFSAVQLPSVQQANNFKVENNVKNAKMSELLLSPVQQRSTPSTIRSALRKSNLKHTENRLELVRPPIVSQSTNIDAEMNMRIVKNEPIEVAEEIQTLKTTSFMRLVKIENDGLIETPNTSVYHSGCYIPQMESDLIEVTHVDLQEELEKSKNNNYKEPEVCGSTMQQSDQCPICTVSYADGGEMICCDKCNVWYHFICVGVQMQPPDEQRWFCASCKPILRKRKISTPSSRAAKRHK